MSKEKIGLIIQDVLQISLLAYSVLLFLELANDGFVSNFFNLWIVFSVVLTVGIVYVFFAKMRFYNVNGNKNVSDVAFLTIGITSLASAMAIYLKTTNILNISPIFIIVIALAAAIISYFFAFSKEYK